MKIKVDYITNSSSTSFVLIYNNEISREAFLKWFGVDPHSDFAYIFKELFENVMRNSEVINDKISDNKSLDDFLSENNLIEEKETIKKAMNEGRSIRVGELESSYGNIQAFFCTKSFRMEDEDIYFSSLANYW